MNKLYVFWGALFLFISPSLHAEDLSVQERVLFAEVEADFVPKKGFFIVTQGEDLPFVIPAEFAPQPVGSGESEGSARYVGAAIAHTGGQKPVRYTFVLEGEADAVRGEEKELPSAQTADENVETLQTEEESLRAVNQSQTKELQTLNGELRRLRSDVDVIADIGRIVVLREERLRIEALLKSIEQEGITLNESLTHIRTRGAPQGYVRQEAQLVRVLVELNAVARKTKKKASPKKNVEQ